jgi:hypothetical protein
MTTFLEFLGNEKRKENPRKLIVLLAKQKHVIMQSSDEIFFIQREYKRNKKARRI